MVENTHNIAEESDNDSILIDDNIQNEEKNIEDSTKKEEVIKSTEELLAEEKDRYLRLFAEFENYKKRSSKERMDFYKYANQEMFNVLLPIVDDFERCVRELERTENDSLNGIKLIQNKFNNTLKDKGLVKMEVSVGDLLDVEKHEAITQIPAPNEDLKDKIVDIIETGYLLQDKVIRFAKVVIGK